MSKKMLISAALMLGVLLPSLPASAMPIANDLGSMPIARDGADLYQSAGWRRRGFHRPRGIWRHPRGIIIRHPRHIIRGIIIHHPIRGLRVHRFHRHGF